MLENNAEDLNVENLTETKSHRAPPIQQDVNTRLVSKLGVFAGLLVGIFIGWRIVARFYGKAPSRSKLVHEP